MPKDSIEQIASQALLDAMELNWRREPQTPQEVRDIIFETAMNNGEVGGVLLEEIPNFYNHDTDSRFYGVKFTWPPHGGTFFEGLIEMAAAYIAEVAKQILLEEEGRTKRPPNVFNR